MTRDELRRRFEDQDRDFYTNMGGQLVWDLISSTDKRTLADGYIAMCEAKINHMLELIRIIKLVAD